jgi:hypothetical protein
MSKTDTELPERLRDAGATDLERRLLHAASREEPSRALSERMAGAIGIAMPEAGSALSEVAKPGTQAASKTAAASGSLAPWIASAVVAAMVAGAFVVIGPAKTPSTPSRTAAAPSSSMRTAAPLPTPVSAPSAADLPRKAPDQRAPSVAASAEAQRGSGPVSSDIAEQIALIDAARLALAGGSAERAITSVRQYQTRYPKGAFRPEAAAIKIEALVKLGHAEEARALAERFLVAHGPSPLANRVTRLAGLNRP